MCYTISIKLSEYLQMYTKMYALLILSLDRLSFVSGENGNYFWFLKFTFSRITNCGAAFMLI